MVRGRVAAYVRTSLLRLGCEPFLFFMCFLYRCGMWGEWAEMAGKQVETLGNQKVSFRFCVRAAGRRSGRMQPVNSYRVPIPIFISTLHRLPSHDSSVDDSVDELELT